METPEKLSEQDIFNLVYTYYKNGGKPGWEDNECRYLTSDGGMCAGGILLKHLGVSDYDLEDASKLGNHSPSIEKMLQVFNLEDKLDCKANDNIIDFQRVHDSAMKNGKDILESFKDLAQKGKLTIPE